MRYFLFIILLIFLHSCSNRNTTVLELTFTSKNNTIIKELNAVHLMEFGFKDGVSSQMNRQSFRNVDCIEPNHFILKGVKEGIYTGLIEVVKEGSTINIGIDSIHIRAGKNYLTRQVNIGTVMLQ